MPVFRGLFPSFVKWALHTKSGVAETVAIGGGPFQLKQQKGILYSRAESLLNNATTPIHEVGVAACFGRVQRLSVSPRTDTMLGTYPTIYSANSRCSL